MIVVEGEDETKSLERSFAAGADHEGAVGPLPRGHQLPVEHAREHAVAKRAGGVGREPRGEGERIGSARLQLRLEHVGDDRTRAGRYAQRVGARGIRATWDALASDPDAYVGDPERGRAELESLFGRLGADPRGGTCIEVGCGPGRMTAALADRFDRVLALDVSPAMLDRARASIPSDRVDFRAISGERLDGVDAEIADAVVCYLVLQHLPSREAIVAYLAEFARVLAPGGEVFVQLPVLAPGPRARAWRATRSALVPLTAFLGPTRRREFRGFRLTRGELDAALSRASLQVVAADVGPDAPYRFSTDLFLRLTR